MQHALSPPMSSQIPKTRLNQEIQIQKALYAFQNKDFSSLNSAADFFEVPRRTLHRRHHGGLTQSTSHERAQILSNAEEKTLVQWVKNYTITGTPITYSLLKDLALRVRAARVTHPSRQVPPH